MMQVAEKVGPTVGLVKITREVYEGKTKSTPMLTFNSPFTRPFGLSPIKCRMIADHPQLIAGFLAEHSEAVGKRIAVEKAKQTKKGRGTKAAMGVTIDAIEAMPENVSKADILAALRQVQGNKAAAAPAAKPVLEQLQAPDPKAFEKQRKQIIKGLKKLCQSFSYASIGKMIGDGVTAQTVKSWVTGKYKPNEERYGDIAAFLAGYENRNPDIIAGLTKVGGNRGWNA